MSEGNKLEAIEFVEEIRKALRRIDGEIYIIHRILDELRTLASSGDKETMK